jgi:uncharacterized protein (UPF0332 family)/predicted nucleotidyltransferase
MATATESSLSRAERRTLDRLTVALESALGEDLLALWLFGSKARGEPAGPETDIDLVLVTRRGSREDGELVRRLLERAAGAEGTFPLAFQTILHTPEEVAERRAKDTFFMREVDRDKIVLAGSEGDEFGERIPFTRRGPGEGGGVRARSEDYLVDARECLAAAHATLDRELPSRAVSEAYYAMFAAAKTALSEADVFARTHAGVWHSFHELFVATGRFPAVLQARAGKGEGERLKADYESVRYTREEGLDAVEAAERFLAATLELLDR